MVGQRMLSIISAPLELVGLAVFHPVYRIYRTTTVTTLPILLLVWTLQLAVHLWLLSSMHDSTCNLSIVSHFCYSSVLKSWNGSPHCQLVQCQQSFSTLILSNCCCRVYIPTHRLNDITYYASDLWSARDHAYRLPKPRYMCWTHVCWFAFVDLTWLSYWCFTRLTFLPSTLDSDRILFPNWIPLKILPMQDWSNQPKKTSQDGLVSHIGLRMLSWSCFILTSYTLIISLVMIFSTIQVPLQDPVFGM
jgi:hypothetical protein